MDNENQKPNDKFKVAEVIAAIDGTRGIKSVIAQKLGCTRATVDRYLRNHASARDAYDAERALWIDQAESVILNAMNEQDVGTAKWVLSRQGKDEGWAERTELTGPDGGPIRVTMMDLAKIAEDQDE